MKFDVRQNHSMSQLSEMYDSVPNNVIWVRKNITLASPLVFMHQRKAGGSSLRVSMLDAGKELDYKVHVPCFNKTECQWFWMENENKYHVHGLHTWWSELSKVDSRINVNITLPLATDTQLNFSCLTNFRDPIKRLESCIYFRFVGTYFKQANVSCINDFPIRNFTKLLIEGRDSFRNSCLNEPFRLFSGITDEVILSELGLDYSNITNIVNFTTKPDRKIQAMQLMNNTLRHLSHCVPVFLDYSESRKLLKIPFPEMYKRNAFEETVVKNVHKSRSCENPDESHVNIMKLLTSYEQVLYDMVMVKVKSAVNEFHV